MLILEVMEAFWVFDNLHVNSGAVKHNIVWKIEVSLDETWSYWDR